MYHIYIYVGLEDVNIFCSPETAVFQWDIQEVGNCHVGKGQRLSEFVIISLQHFATMFKYRGDMFSCSHLR